VTDDGGVERTVHVVDAILHVRAELEGGLKSRYMIENQGLK
jgi:hypothetical protein